MAIWYAHIRKRGLHNEGVDLEVLARRTEGQCAADLVPLVNAAGRRAARLEADAVRMEHFATLDPR